jgi:hypothetical protein
MAPKEHGDVRSHDDTHGGDGADHGTTLTVDNPTTRVSDKNRQEVQNHRADHLREVLVGQPTGGNEQCGQQPPGDECSDVRNHHSREIAAEFLDASPNSGLTSRPRGDKITHWVLPSF